MRQWKINIIWYHLYVESKKKKKDTNDLMCTTETDSQTWDNLWLPKGTGGGGLGWTGSLGLAYAHWGIWNDWPVGTCCIAQGTLPNILWLSIWDKNLKKNGCVYLYNLLYSRNNHNIVIQLFFNKTSKNKNTHTGYISVIGKECTPKKSPLVLPPHVITKSSKTSCTFAP